MPMHAAEHRWLWKIIAVCLLLGSIGMFGPAIVLRETPRERLTNLAAAQAELDRKRDLVRSKRAALQDELETLQLKASGILKGLAWRKVREEDYNAERIRHIDGIREYLADGRAKMEAMVLETTQTLKNTFQEAQKHVGYIGTHTKSHAHDQNQDAGEPVVKPIPPTDDGLPTIQLQPQQVVEQPKFVPSAPTVLPKATPAPAPRPTKLRPKPNPTPKPTQSTSWIPDTMTIVYVGGGLILVVLVLAMLSSLYEQQVGYPFTPRKPKTRTSLGNKEDRVTRNLDFGEVNEEEDDDSRGNRANLYGTEFIPNDASKLIVMMSEQSPATSRSLWRKLATSVKMSQLEEVQLRKYQSVQQKSLEKAAEYAASDEICTDADELYSHDALVLRYSLRKNRGIDAVIRRLWNFEAERDALGCLYKEGYVAFYVSIAKFLDAEFEGGSIVDTVTSEWNTDCKGQLTMGYAEFFDSLFQLADVWVDSLEPQDYIAFLEKISDNIFIRRGDKCVLRDHTDIIFINTNEQEREKLEKTRAKKERAMEDAKTSKNEAKVFPKIDPNTDVAARWNLQLQSNNRIKKPPPSKRMTPKSTSRETSKNTRYIPAQAPKITSKSKFSSQQMGFLDNSPSSQDPYANDLNDKGSSLPTMRDENCIQSNHQNNLPSNTQSIPINTLQANGSMTSQSFAQGDINGQMSSIDGSSASHQSLLGKALDNDHSSIVQPLTTTIVEDGALSATASGEYFWTAERLRSSNQPPPREPRENIIPLQAQDDVPKASYEPQNQLGFTQFSEGNFQFGLIEDSSSGGRHQAHRSKPSRVAFGRKFNNQGMYQVDQIPNEESQFDALRAVLPTAVALPTKPITKPTTAPIHYTGSANEEPQLDNCPWRLEPSPTRSPAKAQLVPSDQELIESMILGSGFDNSELDGQANLKLDWQLLKQPHDASDIEQLQFAVVGGRLAVSKHGQVEIPFNNAFDQIDDIEEPNLCIEIPCQNIDPELRSNFQRHQLQPISYDNPPHIHMRSRDFRVDFIVQNGLRKQTLEAPRVKRKQSLRNVQSLPVLPRQVVKKESTFDQQGLLTEKFVPSRIELLKRRHRLLHSQQHAAPLKDSTWNGD